MGMQLHNCSRCKVHIFACMVILLAQLQAAASCTEHAHGYYWAIEILCSITYSAHLYMGPRVCGVHVIASSTAAHAVCTSTVTIRQLRSSAVLHILILLIYIWLWGFVGPTHQRVVLLHIQYGRGPSYLSKIYSSERGREINWYIVY